MRGDLTDAQLEALIRWARALPDREKGENVLRVVAELRALRDRESSTRFLMGLDEEV